MKLEKQVCSLELAKKLKEAGVKQRGCFTWVQDSDTEKYKLESFSTQFHGAVHNYYAMGYDGSDGITRKAQKGAGKMFPAFTVAELGELLPAFIGIGEKKNKKKFKLYIAKNENDEWFIEYQEWSLKVIDNYEYAY